MSTLDFGSIKSEFFKFIQEKEQHSGAATNPIKDDTSIFAYASEWNNFVKEKGRELGIPSNFSGSIMDLINLYDENKEEFAIDKKDKDSKNFFTQFISDLLGNKEVKDLVDKDDNEKISKDEIAAFLEELDKYDKKEGEFSLTDMFTGYDAIKNGTFSLGEPQEEEPAAETPTPNSPGNVDGGGGTPSTPTTPTPTQTPSQTPTDNPDGKDPKLMSAEQLKTEKTNTENAKKANLDKYAAIMNGTDESVKALKDNITTTYDAFQKKLKEINKDLSTKYDEAKTSVDNKQKAIDDKTIEITNTKSELDDAKTTVTNAESKVSTLETTISSLESALGSADNDKKAEIQGQIDSAKAELETAKQARDTAKAKKDELEQKVNTLEQEKTALEGELTTLKEEVTKLDGEISKLYDANPELKTVKEAYDQAQTDYETGRKEALTSVESAIKENQEYLDKINTQIAEVENKEISNKYNSDEATTKIENKIKEVGGNPDNATAVEQDDGSYVVTEKNDDGTEVTYKFDKDGNFISYSNAMGTFTANGDSVTLSSDKTQKWAKDQPTYTINTSLEDFVSQIRKSAPNAEQFINTALGAFNESGYQGQGDNCVLYANYVFSKMGHPIGSTSAEVKSSNQEVSAANAKTGDIYNNGERHIGMILAHIKDKNGNDIFLTADANASGVTINIRDGKDDSLRASSRYYKGISA